MSFAMNVLIGRPWSKRKMPEKLHPPDQPGYARLLVPHERQLVGPR